MGTSPSRRRTSLHEGSVTGHYGVVLRRCQIHWLLHGQTKLNQDCGDTRHPGQLQHVGSFCLLLPAPEAIVAQERQGQTNPNDHLFESSQLIERAVIRPTGSRRHLVRYVFGLTSASECDARKDNTRVLTSPLQR